MEIGEIVGSTMDLYLNLRAMPALQDLSDADVRLMTRDRLSEALQGYSVVERPDCCLAEPLSVEWEHEPGCLQNEVVHPDEPGTDPALFTVESLPDEARQRVQAMAKQFKEQFGPVVQQHPEFAPILFSLTEAVVKAHIRGESIEARPQWRPGGLLPDHAIIDSVEMGNLIIQPFKPENVQPASYDITLGDAFMVFRHNLKIIDPEQRQDLMHRIVLEPGEEYVLHPGEFVLGASVEEFFVPPDLAIQLGGKSSLGRLGVQVHATAGFVDPGYQGNITLELSNVTRLPILLRPGMKIGQVVFLSLESPCERPYGSPGLGSKYVGQAASGVVQSLYHKNAEHNAHMHYEVRGGGPNTGNQDQR